MKIRCRLRVYAVSFLCLAFSYEKAVAQNITNDTVYVASTSMIQITFHSPIDKASMPNGDRSYEITVTSDAMSIMVTALKKDTRDQLLIVKEGNREHKLTLSYKENTTPRLIDWSDLKKLELHVKKNRPPAAGNESAKEIKETGQKTVQPATLAENPATQPAATDAARNRNALAEANLLFKQGHLPEAKQKYMSITDPALADLIQPRIAEIEKKIKDKQQATKTNESDSIFKAYVTRGDKAYGTGLLAEAEMNYTEALKMKPDNAALKKRLSGIQVKKENEIFNGWKEKADSAFQKKDIETAKMAYGEALKIKKGDSYIAAKLRRLQEWENQPQYQDARRIDSVKRVEYKKAILTADKFYELKGYDIAAEEYRRALRIFADSTYPDNQLKKIIQLNPDLQKDKRPKEIKIKQR